MSKNYNVGIIGCGMIADIHVEAILSFMPHSKIHVCDNIIMKAELLKRKYNLEKSYSSVAEMLNNVKLFSVHILTPPNLHVKHAIECIEAESNVLIEKPVALSLSEALKLYDIAEKNDISVYVNHSLLHQACVKKTISMINRSKEKILYIYSYFGMEDGPIDYDDKNFMHWKSQIAGGSLVR